MEVESLDAVPRALKLMIAMLLMRIMTSLLLLAVALTIITTTEIVMILLIKKVFINNYSNGNICPFDTK